MIALHSVCLAQCLGEGSQPVKETSSPPCDHHQNGVPNSNDSTAPSATCSEGPALEAKTSPLIKCCLVLAPMPDIASATLTPADSFWQATQEFVKSPNTSLHVPLTALRI